MRNVACCRSFQARNGRSLLTLDDYALQAFDEPKDIASLGFTDREVVEGLGNVARDYRPIAAANSHPLMRQLQEGAKGEPRRRMP